MEQDHQESDIFARRGERYKRTPASHPLRLRAQKRTASAFRAKLSMKRKSLFKENGKAFIRSKTDVVYKDFKFFFTVEFEVHD